MGVEALHRRRIQWLGQKEAIVDLTGQVVLITGGSRGLGRAFAQSFLYLPVSSLTTTSEIKGEHSMSFFPKLSGSIWSS
jgi:FlaA1/EpsC-like NDP-sugar epimerase